MQQPAEQGHAVNLATILRPGPGRERGRERKTKEEKKGGGGNALTRRVHLSTCSGSSHAVSPTCR
jgi:hypothetical protein